MQSRSYTYFVSALIALMLVLLPITGQAQDKSKAIAFKIPAGALADALNLYSRQAGITSLMKSAWYVECQPLPSAETSILKKSYSRY